MWIFYFCSNILACDASPSAAASRRYVHCQSFRLRRTAAQSFRLQHISCGGPPPKFSAAGGPGQPAAAGFQPAASAASAGQAGTLGLNINDHRQINV
jgi:hypothetical protein